MAKFMLLLGGVQRPAGATGDFAAVMERYRSWTQSLVESGHFVATHKLFRDQGARLTVRDGRVVDGPYVESKEGIGGYYLVEAKDLDEAKRLAQGCPTLVEQLGWVDVRPVEI
jgi:hypothetical protein